MVATVAGNDVRKCAKEGIGLGFNLKGARVVHAYFQRSRIGRAKEVDRCSCSRVACQCPSIISRCSIGGKKRIGSGGQLLPWGERRKSPRTGAVADAD